MTSLSLIDTAIDAITYDALVIGVGKSATGPVLAPGAERLEKKVKGGLLAALTTLGATGAEGDIVRVATLGGIKSAVIVATGLGDVPAAGGTYGTEAIRRAAGGAVRALAGRSRVALTLGLVNGEDSAADLRAAGEGALLGAYAFTEHRSSEPDCAPVQNLALVVPKARDAQAKRAVAEATAVGHGVHLARDLINTAPNVLPPAVFADRAVAVAKRSGLAVEVLDEEALADGGFGGILAVGMGSSRPPRLVHLSYRGKRAAASVALVGKGITFDTGGISIKPANGMGEMKSDMSGAAGMLAVISAVAELGLRLDVDAWLPMAENMPSGSAYRPGDVVTMRGGKTVEVLNTDAEGRMVLGDAIARASEDDPDFLVEASTLTGGAVVSLGHRTAGLMGADEFVARVRSAADRAGEATWPMPMAEDVVKAMESPVADVSQISADHDRAGHMLQGGIFLANFVPDDLPWAHIDIAGPAYNSGAPYGYTPKGGTGFVVRTVIALLEDLAAG